MLDMIQMQAWEEIQAMAQATSQIKDRSIMPQITQADLEQALIDIESEHGIAFERDIVDPRSLKPSQGELSLKKIESGVARLLNQSHEPRPVLVSNDGYVLDGHHRWAANYICNVPLHCWTMHAPMLVCLKAIADHPASFNISLHEASNPTANQYSQIFCDMDGVLVDFISGSEKVLGFKFNDKEAAQALKLDNEGKWNILSTKEKFWLNLDKMPDADKLWAAIKPLTPFILSAPAKAMPTCAAEKKLWAQRHLGLPPNRVICVAAEDKKHYARINGHRNVLIDDYARNIEQWRAAGGIGILHTSAAKTIAELKTLGIIR